MNKNVLADAVGMIS